MTTAEILSEEFMAHCFAIYKSGAKQKDPLGLLSDARKLDQENRVKYGRTSFGN